MSEELPETSHTQPGPRYSDGARRLVALSITAIFIAFITASISLFLYTTSGDIYLDRSRPGFISDDEPITDNEQTDSATTFSPDGSITKDALEEYLQKFDDLLEDITSDPDAFSSSALSDEALNITGSADY